MRFIGDGKIKHTGSLVFGVESRALQIVLRKTGQKENLGEGECNNLELETESRAVSDRRETTQRSRKAEKKGPANVLNLFPGLIRRSSQEDALPKPG